MFLPFFTIGMIENHNLARGTEMCEALTKGYQYK